MAFYIRILFEIDSNRKRFAMNRFQRLLIFSLLLFFSCEVKSQYFLTGSDPSAVRWKQIHGLDYRVIYPEEDSVRALEYYKSFLAATPLVTRNMGSAFPPLDVVLHSYTTRS
ncbi:MAG: hypothetical protein CVU06_15525, partial [Bacteroidetes bacterium HGW-Bacteroidetes-22]